MKTNDSQVCVILLGCMLLLCLTIPSCKAPDQDVIAKVLKLSATKEIQACKYHSIQLVPDYNHLIVHLIWIQSSNFDWLFDELHIPQPEKDTSQFSSEKRIECASELLTPEELPTWWPEKFGPGFTRSYHRFCGVDTTNLLTLDDFDHGCGFLEMMVKMDSCFILKWDESGP